MTHYERRYKTLDEQFKQPRDGRLTDSTIEVRFFTFKSRHEHSPRVDHPVQVSDQRIAENEAFDYAIFLPASNHKFDQAILLLHGLNERSWSKYLPWAEALCDCTGKPVILFPIAFHMNRAPFSWSNPRSLANLLTFRRDAYKGDRTISFANIALSDRISQCPERFYLSGRQTWADLTALFDEIKWGRHLLFKAGTAVDIFAYSIGAFLSQVALMANQRNLFSDTRLFLFCGGSIFGSMQGISRSIMDRPAFELLQHYYMHVFGNEQAGTRPLWKRDKAFQAFFQMIMPQRFRAHREDFFAGIAHRVRGIALAKDSVIPYHGIEEAMGAETTRKNIQLIDYPFEYSHESPFPINTKQPCEVNKAFKHLISKAADFLG